MKTHRCLLLLALSIAVSACSSPADPGFGSNGIVGRWKWIMTDHAWHVPHEYPPAGEEHVTTLTSNNVYTRIVDGRLVHTGSYSITEGTETSGSIAFDGALYSESFSVRGDTLSIGNPEVDGPNQIFIRMRQ